ncbi:MAG: hypothetical protein JETT_2145 [Candidatus Jettenia ecosi]|uniref:DUF2344 domain-containing protein n=1 Tax=Candidatus Jettenia ecosi TaxID=2494326 RepID=A0A533QB34_9BACT|nr:MAG: hypothetical protein JETT_2145 [Candidatus Jettenia ecosi]
MRVFERAIRRANLPIVMSKGFNPHPKLSIPLALSVGIIGRDEILELDLQKSIPSEVLVKSLGLQLPKEISLLSAEDISNSKKDLVRNMTYEIVFKNTYFLEAVKINELLQQSSIIVNRSKDGHQKRFNIRPSIEEIKEKPNGLILTIKPTPEGTAKPEEVLHALCGGREKEFFEIIRMKVNLSSSAD